MIGRLLRLLGRRDPLPREPLAPDAAPDFGPSMAYQARYLRETAPARAELAPTEPMLRAIRERRATTQHGAPVERCGAGV